MLACGAIVWLLLTALTVEAQPATSVPRIGFIEAGSRSANQHLLDAFRRRLRELGYVDGQNVVIEDRWAEGRTERFPALIDELLRLKVAVMVVASTPGARAAKQSTSAVPVVLRSAPSRTRTSAVSSSSPIR
jgi:putative tryptophan/tyrosine transport system substrate-binding protein